MKKILKSELVISIAFFVMTMCIFGSLELFFTNEAELWFSRSDALIISGLLSVATIVVLSGIGLLLRGRGRSLFAALLFIVTLCLYIQGNFLNTNYGVLDGKTIEWSEYATRTMINTGCWIVAMVLMLAIKMKKPQQFQNVARMLAACVMAVQCLTLGVLFMSDVSLADEEGKQLTVDHMTEIGSDDNIVIFVLDSFDDPLMDSLMETDGEKYQTVFTDFTRYTDCSASGATTAAALPILITGEYFSDGSRYSEYTDKAFNSDGLYDALKEKNYNVGIYTDAAYIGNSAEGYVNNYVEGDGTPNSYVGLASQYSKFTMFRYAPDILKKYFWLYTAEFEEYKPSSSYVLDDAAVYQAIAQNGLRIEGKNSFRLIHLCGAHYPYLINEKAQPDETATREQQAKGNLHIVEEYINQMKECGVYEDAMIIVTSDHGDSSNYAAPILFVKERGVTATYAENDAPVSHIDLHPTLFSYLGIEKGDSFSEISPTEQRDRLFYLRLQDGGSFYMKEYLISDKVSIVGCGTPTGKRLAPIKEIIPVTIGKTMGLDIDGQALSYVVSGLDIWPMDSVETQGTEAVFRLPMEGIQSKALNVSIDVLKIYTEEVKQRVQIYANEQLCYEGTVTGQQSLRFTVQPEMLTKQELELKLVLQSKWCPLYLSGITIEYDRN